MFLDISNALPRSRVDIHHVCVHACQCIVYKMYIEKKKERYKREVVQVRDACIRKCLV